MAQENKLPLCPHFDSKTGCCIESSLHNLGIWKEAEEFFKEQGIEQPVLHRGPPWHWRCRSKLAVRGTSKEPLIGLFKAGTHDVRPIPSCQIHHPQINEASASIRKLLQDQGLTPYQEKDHLGELRYLQFVVERATGKVQASFVLNFDRFSHSRVKMWMTLLEKIGKEDGGLFWHSLWINLNSKPTNTIFGEAWKLCYGQELLWEKFGHISVCYQPASFAQANLDLFEKLLERIKNIVLDQAKVAEFYAGVGVIGLYIASKCFWVRCAELNPHAAYCFEISKDQLPIQDASKITFHTGAAQKLIEILDSANVVVVDPPRKGMDAALLKAIQEASTVKQLIYVSCGWPSFRRDCESLLSQGWSLNSAEGYLFFPGSEHIEILAEFRRT